MKEGDIVLTPLPQADRQIKKRPALFLREMPPFKDALVCGISTQLHPQVLGFDEIISQQDPDFSDSGLLVDSLIRLGVLTVIPRRKIVGSIGTISQTRHQKLLQNLSDYLRTREWMIVAIATPIKVSTKQILCPWVRVYASEDV